MVLTGSAVAITTSPFKNRIRSASASTWPISIIAVRLNSFASGAKPRSSRWKWKYMYWWTAASSSATDLFSNSILFSLFTAITSVYLGFHHQSTCHEAWERFCRGVFFGNAEGRQTLVAPRLLMLPARQEG